MSTSKVHTCILCRQRVLFKKLFYSPEVKYPKLLYNICMFIGTYDDDDMSRY